MKDYLINEEDIAFRRAKETDDMKTIAELIYKTDQYIYPFWFKSLDKCIEILPNLMKEDNFIFNYKNIYIAYDKRNNNIIGALIALDKSINLNYDYSTLEKTNESYNFTVNHYLKELINDVNSYTNNEMYISNLCVQTVLRSERIGTKLMGYFLKQMDKAGFEEYHLDCLLHNLRAKNLYHSMGFKEVKEVIGFDGTETSDVEVVFMTRKKGGIINYPLKVTVNEE